MKATRIRARHLLLVLVIAYSCAIVLWNLLRHTSVSGWWPFQMVSVFSAWIYLPLIPLAGAILFWREWRAGAWLVLPLLLFGWEYGQLFVPVARGAGEGTPLRVMTANLNFQNRDAARMAKLVADLGPDVVALQELGTGMSAPLADMVRAEYPYQALYPRADTRGMGVLSRYPITDERPPEMGAGECSCQQVTVDVKGQRVTVLNAHPNPPSIGARRAGPLVLPTGFSTREQELAALALRHRASTIGTPLLIAGDMNTTDSERPYWILAQVYHDSYREAGHGFGFTFPAPNRTARLPIPLIRIDYVFHDDSWETRAVSVESLPGSDHRGIYAELMPRPGAGGAGVKPAATPRGGVPPRGEGHSIAGG